MNAEPELKVIYQGEPAPVKSKIRPWHWVAYYAYNLARKPHVWKLKREQERIYKEIRFGLTNQVFPTLRVEGFGKNCANCRNAYGTLREQVFISIIRMIVKNMRCDEHPAAYDQFLKVYEIEFDRNEALSAEINGFKR